MQLCTSSVKIIFWRKTRQVSEKGNPHLIIHLYLNMQWNCLALRKMEKRASVAYSNSSKEKHYKVITNISTHDCLYWCKSRGNYKFVVFVWTPYLHLQHLNVYKSLLSLSLPSFNIVHCYWNGAVGVLKHQRSRSLLCLGQFNSTLANTPKGARNREIITRPEHPPV